MEVDILIDEFTNCLVERKTEGAGGYRVQVTSNTNYAERL